MASPWSAPAWMKTNQSLFGGELQFQWYGSYAIYFKKFIEAYRAAGLPIDAVTLQNEPLFTSNYPTMRMSAGQQADLISNYFGPLFASSSISTEILLYDHNWDNTQFADFILDDSATRQFVAGTAFHGYAGDVGAQSVLHNAHPDKGIYFTEISGGDFAPNFDDNLVFGVQNIIIRNARNWGRTALYWNLALDENHGPHQNGCDDCRGVVTVDSATGDATMNEEFYTIAHASKFVRPGAVRIDSVSLNEQLETVAFQNPDGSKVLITLNPGNSVRSFRIVEQEQHFDYQLPGKSVATFVWGNVAADFDDNGVLDGSDIDRLVAAIAAGSASTLFDLNRDGQLDGQDSTSGWPMQAQEISIREIPIYAATSTWTARSTGRILEPGTHSSTRTRRPGCAAISMRTESPTAAIFQSGIVTNLPPLERRSWCQSRQGGSFCCGFSRPFPTVAIATGRTRSARPT